MLAILFICLVVFAAVSIPIGIAMGLGTLICLIFATNIDPVMIAQNAFAGIDSFSLMAIPFFMLAGNFMRYGGISKRLLDLATVPLIRHKPKGQIILLQDLQIMPF